VADEKFNSMSALAPLKAFQRATVDHVFQRLHSDPDGTRQFLVADEVGLGKTMVARGVIARTIEALWDRVPRIDIIYVCSNGAIAAQNLARLNVMEREAKVLPTRLTMLPLVLGGSNSLRKNRVNFVSLTPGTTFDLKSSGGWARERALILQLLQDMLSAPGDASRVFKGRSGEAGWRRERDWVASEASNGNIDLEIAEKFRQAVSTAPGLINRIDDLCAEVAHRQAVNSDLRHACTTLVGELRGMLAQASVQSLEPDLIILDEFQRFHDLLHGNDEAADLARQLFTYTDAVGNSAKTLLLSATPYRMLTLAGDAPEDGDHHRDFLDVLQFLFGAEDGVVRRDEIAAEMRRFRAAMQALPTGFETARTIRLSLEQRLRRVIARTERVAETADRDAMILELHHEVDLRKEDLIEARTIAAVAAAAGAPSTVEYWKSSPWLLNMMRGYKLADLLKEQAKAPSPELRAAMKAATRLQIDPQAIENYAPLVPANGRMRKLADLSLADDMARRLWIAPSLPYFGERQPVSKMLIFSEWTMVPDAIAGFLSYEAERQMGMGKGHTYSDPPTTRPLQFRSAQGRLAGLRALQLVIPSPRLAALADPLMLVREEGPFADLQALRSAVASRLRPLAHALVDHSAEAGEGGWDWSSAAALDINSPTFSIWLRGDDLRAEGEEEAWPDHLDKLNNTASQALGKTDAEHLLGHLVDVALGSPATCALRALSRIAPGLPLDDPALLTAAAHVGMAFRTLFNQPETQALLREDGDVYWRAVLRYAAEHDLQSVLDEYVHILFEAEGQIGHLPSSAVRTVAERMAEALSLRPAQIELNHYEVRRGRIQQSHPITLRGRFAMRLAQKGEDETGVARTGLVRTAFNSPFRPFVLASTSVGQEGLDFHPYCHRIVHWNLPGNPVDMEQREGRVHRYKNHAVRLNLVAGFADTIHVGEGIDPWAAMFDAAHERATREGDLEPFWVLDGPVKVERHILSLPFSREETRLSWLRRSVAIYRLAFGQPRQDDLLALLDKARDALSDRELGELQINLRPSAVASASPEMGLK
jgi:hypothetical protein